MSIPLCLPTFPAASPCVPLCNPGVLCGKGVASREQRIGTHNLQAPTALVNRRSTTRKVTPITQHHRPVIAIYGRQRDEGRLQR